MPKNAQHKLNRLNTRKIISKIALSICLIAALIAIVILLAILGIIVFKGIGALNLNVFISDTASPWDNGGLRNAIIGQVILSLGAFLIGTPFGILGGTYLREYAKNAKIKAFIRNVNDIMMSAPSIIIATFVYAIIVVPSGHFSGWAGIVALSIIMFPIILKTTDDMLSLVPDSLREASAALGAPKYKTTISIVYKSAKLGILTGVLLAFSRIMGEAAPLLFTSLNNSFLSLNLNEPFPSLTITMFQYTTSPYPEWQELGFAAAFILAFTILSINITSKIILNISKRGEK
ncbi:phosphate ABC transporter, permease protein PstA [Helicobacter sp. 16-1353]|uniref:phosphate ABC transporter permease PstA n=1 Tax=Helicobacter sp. 16-1353 TaxID=2004996 RepID=UPI000DCCD6F5|nr:phosphate ABC transporter permease PstA [Helicobacter sp. 16-1353]RAX53982.1 phosphate ABC transporter, permease protein PstA [Helicobacter sp. 16-1353]